MIAADAVAEVEDSSEALPAVAPSAGYAERAKRFGGIWMVLLG